MVDRQLIERDLDEFVEGEAWPEALEDGESAPVMDPTTATRILRRMRRLTHEVAAIVDTAENELARIAQWRDDRVATIQKQIDWAGRSLEPFARDVIPGSGRKSFPLPDGMLKLASPGQGKVIVEDDEAFINWANDRGMVGDDNDPNVVMAVLTVSKTQITKLLEQDAMPMAVEIEDDGSETNVFGFHTHDGDPVPGVTRRVAAKDKFGYVIGED